MRTTEKVARDCAATSEKATCGDACEWADYEQGAKDATRSRDTEIAKELLERIEKCKLKLGTMRTEEAVILFEFFELAKQLDGEAK
jgi:hypothetical protein